MSAKPETAGKTAGITTDQPERRKWALITGASSGIGAAFARQLASQGYFLILNGRRAEKLTPLKAELERLYSGRHELVLGDLREAPVIEELITLGNRNEIDLLINNAGYGAGKDFLQDDAAAQLGMLQVHCTAVVQLCRGLIPGMQQRGRGEVINVSSVAGEQSLPKSVMYGASKSFLTRFTEALALELRPSGVRMQALLPGFTHTDFHDKLPEWEREKRNRGIVRWQSASQVAEYSLNMLKKRPGKIIAIPGFFNRLIAKIPVLLPKKLYYAMAVRITR